MDALNHTGDVPPRTPTELDQIAEDWLDRQIALVPELKVMLGRDGDDGSYADYSPAGAEAGLDAARHTLTAAKAASATDLTDTITQSELIRTLDLAIEQHESEQWKADLNIIASPAQNIREIFDLLPTETSEDHQRFAARLAQLPKALSGYQETLKLGVSDGQVPARRQVAAVVNQIGDITSNQGFFASIAEQGEQWLGEQFVALVERARLAYSEFQQFLSTDLLPVARETDAVGRDVYALNSRQFIGFAVDLDETYDWGIDQLHGVIAEQERVAELIVPGGSIADAIAHLEADPATKLHGTDALQRWMQETSNEAIAQLNGSQFDIPDSLQQLECLIAPTNTGGIYYTGPSEDLSRPGRMWWSVPTGVTEFDTWREKTTVYHEGVPGHHLQVGLATYYRAQLNSWRRFNWNSGHGEGWALYAERLMDDLGYLTTPADRLGMLDGQRLRAARVVADIGVHLGKPKPDGTGPWTGDDVFSFMSQHVAMPKEFVEFESLRYLGWAGQAPSYAVGQRRWLQLRDSWLANGHGTLQQFHRVALAHGSVGLDSLQAALTSATS